MSQGKPLEFTKAAPVQEAPRQETPKSPEPRPDAERVFRCIIHPGKDGSQHKVQLPRPDTKQGGKWRILDRGVEVELTESEIARLKSRKVIKTIQEFDEDGESADLAHRP